MPQCCPPTEFSFSNATSTTIAYDEAMRAKYGTKPRVNVYYYDTVSGELYLSPFFTVVKFISNNIIVDHGGPNSGIISVT
jgi:hypothetical protein